MSDDAPVSIFGASGDLGHRIVEGILARGGRVRAFLRRPGSEVPSLASFAEHPGLEVVPFSLEQSTGDIARAIDGSRVVISTLLGDADVMIDGQHTVFRAAQAAGAERIIPSDFSMNLVKTPYGINDLTDQRKRADEIFDELSIRPLSVNTGSFPEYTFSQMFQIIDWDRRVLEHYGDETSPADYTTIPDTAAFTAAVALAPELADGEQFHPVANRASFAQVRDAVAEGTGIELELVRKGDLEDLRAKVEELYALGPDALYPARFHGYQLIAQSGWGTLERDDAPRVSDVAPQTLAEYFAERARLADCGRMPLGDIPKFSNAGH